MYAITSYQICQDNQCFISSLFCSKSTRSSLISVVWIQSTFYLADKIWVSVISQRCRGSTKRSHFLAQCASWHSDWRIITTNTLNVILGGKENRWRRRKGSWRLIRRTYCRRRKTNIDSKRLRLPCNDPRRKSGISPNPWRVWLAVKPSSLPNGCYLTNASASRIGPSLVDSASRDSAAVSRWKSIEPNLISSTIPFRVLDAALPPRPSRI